jgi:hypothetical protein
VGSVLIIALLKEYPNTNCLTIHDQTIRYDNAEGSKRRISCCAVLYFENAIVSWSGLAGGDL